LPKRHYGSRATACGKPLNACALCILRRTGDAGAIWMLPWLTPAVSHARRQQINLPNTMNDKPASESPEVVTSKGIGSSALLGFDVTVYEMSCIVFAKNAAQAKWRAVKGWRDAGYGGKRQWPSVSARRNPRWDSFPHKDQSRCWIPEYVRDLCPSA